MSKMRWATRSSARTRPASAIARPRFVATSAAASTPDWNKLQDLVAEPLNELSRRISDEIRRRESPDSLVPIDRDPVPPEYAEQCDATTNALGAVNDRCVAGLGIAGLGSVGWPCSLALRLWPCCGAIGVRHTSPLTTGIAVALKAIGLAALALCLIEPLLSRHAGAARGKHLRHRCRQ